MRVGKAKNHKRPDPFEEEQPAGYHYSRQERLSLQTAPRFRDKRGGIFRRNRTLLILLLDLVIVVIIGVFLVRFLYARVNRAELQGYSVVLRGVLYEEVVLAALAVTNTQAGSENEERVYARFSLERNPEEVDSTYISSALPRQGEERILRATIPAPKEARTLYAEVRIGDTVEHLSAGLEP
jgi:hypothetical protein